MAGTSIISFDLNGWGGNKGGLIQWLSLAGQLSVEIAGENIPTDRVFIDGTTTADSVQVSLIY